MFLLTLTKQFVLPKKLAKDDNYVLWDWYTRLRGTVSWDFYSPFFQQSLSMINMIQSFDITHTRNGVKIIQEVGQSSHISGKWKVTVYQHLLNIYICWSYGKTNFVMSLFEISPIFRDEINRECNIFSSLTWKTNIICYIPFYRKIILLTGSLFLQQLL